MADKLKPGDRVAFLNHEGGGQVLSIIDDHNLMLELDEGFEVPVNRKEVVKVRDFTKGNATEAPAPEAEKSPDQSPHSSSEPYGTFLAFDQSKSETNLSLYLINHTPYTLYFQVYEKPGEQAYKGLSHGQLSPFGYQLLNRYQTNHFASWPLIVVQGLYFAEATDVLPEPFVYQFQTKAKAFFKAVRTAPVLASPAHLFQVDQPETGLKTEGLEKLSLLDEGNAEIEAFGEPVIHADLDQPPEVVDLHIDRLVPDYKQMERQAILEYQLSYFEKMLDKAITHKYKRIIFIHGVGNGVLRERVHRKLKQNQAVRSYKEADNQRYGYGATEVRFYTA